MSERFVEWRDRSSGIRAACGRKSSSRGCPRRAGARLGCGAGVPDTLRLAGRFPGDRRRRLRGEGKPFTRAAFTSSSRSRSTRPSRSMLSNHVPLRSRWVARTETPGTRVWPNGVRTVRSVQASLVFANYKSRVRLKRYMVVDVCPYPAPAMNPRPRDLRDRRGGETGREYVPTPARS
jgi:hypothetical protein